MLADQTGYALEPNEEGDKTLFAVGRGFEDNVLLRAFHQGVTREGPLGNLAADRFKEEEINIGLDQLLMIRLAQQLGAAPDKLRGGEGDKISNQRPIGDRAARYFQDDIRRFVRAYSGGIPRHAFVELLESCISVGLTTIVTSAIDLLFDWSETGQILKKCDQHPTYLFVDCSNGVDRWLRRLAEQSMEDFMRRIERFPVVLMALRLLDHGARYDPKIRKLNISTRPYATDWLNLLGELLHRRREEAQPILYELERKSHELAERLQDDYPQAAEVLRNEQAQDNPLWRMAEALTSLQGRGSTQANLIKMVDSILLTDRPNGLAIKRSLIRKVGPSNGAKKRDVRSLVLTDAVLEYLVHLHLLPAGNKSGHRPLSFKDFVSALCKRYGFCIEVAPPGMTISNELLQENRARLERRLRVSGTASRRKRCRSNETSAGAVRFY